VVSEFEISEWLSGLGAKAARVKYGSSKALRVASKESPKLVYPHFDRFVKLMIGDNTFQRWNAIWTIGHLAAADREGRIEKILHRFLLPITGAEMIGAASVIGAGADIVLAKPHLADQVARAILKVERASYQRPECRNVAIGHAITSLDRFFPLIERKHKVMVFIERQLGNPRPATRRKAEKFRRKWLVSSE
jgi:hypothetical protein